METSAKRIKSNRTLNLSPALDPLPNRNHHPDLTPLRPWQPPDVPPPSPAPSRTCRPVVMIGIRVVGRWTDAVSSIETSRGASSSRGSARLTRTPCAAAPPAGPLTARSAPWQNPKNSTIRAQPRRPNRMVKGPPACSPDRFPAPQRCRAAPPTVTHRSRDWMIWTRTSPCCSCS